MLTRMLAQLFKILSVLLIIPNVIWGLKCNGGVTSTHNGKMVVQKSYEQTCPERPGQFCETATVEIYMNGIPSQLVIGSCDENCLIETSYGCPSILASLRKTFQEGNSNVTYNISSCHVSCCNDADFCNRKPDLPQDPVVLGERRCYNGMRVVTENKETVVNNVEAITCRANENMQGSTSCLRATLEMNGGTPETTGSMMLYECQPTSICDSFTCDLILKTLPRDTRSIVTSCETSCCTENFCNHSLRCTVNCVGMSILVFIAMCFLVFLDRN